MTLRAGVAKLAGAALAGSLLIFAAPAAAKPCHPHHPGGNAEVNQYLETIPGPCGDQPIGGNGSGNQGTSTGSGGGSAGLPPGALAQLESMGTEGSQAAGFAQGTNPGGPAASGNGKSGGGSSSGSGRGSGTAANGTSSDGSFLSALKDVLAGTNASDSTGSQGLGIWLPILLAMVFVGGLSVLALRRGRTG